MVPEGTRSVRLCTKVPEAEIAMGPGAGGISFEDVGLGASEFVADEAEGWVRISAETSIDNCDTGADWIKGADWTRLNDAVLCTSSGEGVTCTATADKVVGTASCKDNVFRKIIGEVVFCID